MVEFDAFAGDIALGGLRNMLEIKILVCYMLSRVKEPMTRKQLCDCLQEEGLVNFFDLNEAIDDLLKQKMLQEEEYLNEACITVTEAGRSNAETLETTLTAGVIAIVGIVLLLLVLYHFAGFVSAVSMLIYTFLVFGVFWLVGGVLTLPGIAALVLGIGMAVVEYLWIRKV